MATRCEITIEGYTTAKLYKHWDGYPEANEKWLNDFNKSFVENRGIDPDYKFAQLIRSSAFDAEKYGLDDSRYTGWGVVNYNDDVGTEYRYTLMNNGDVKVINL